jgi:hypothetical protein
MRFAGKIIVQIGDRVVHVVCNVIYRSTMSSQSKNTTRAKTVEERVAENTEIDGI